MPKVFLLGNEQRTILLGCGCWMGAWFLLVEGSGFGRRPLASGGIAHITVCQDILICSISTGAGDMGRTTFYMISVHLLATFCKPRVSWNQPTRLVLLNWQFLDTRFGQNTQPMQRRGNEGFSTSIGASTYILIVACTIEAFGRENLSRKLR